VVASSGNRVQRPDEVHQVLAITHNQNRSRHLALRPAQRQPLAPDPSGQKEADQAGWQSDGHIATGHLQAKHVAGNRHYGEKPPRGGGHGSVFLRPMPEKAAVVGTL